jgi:ATP-dependent Clp protease protease subunit
VSEKTPEKKAKKADPEKKSVKAQLRAIELAKAEIELKAAENDYELDQIRMRGYRADAQWKKAGDRNHGVFRLESYVGSNVVDLAGDMQQWARLESSKGKPITLYVTSGGGSVIAGFALYDQLRTLSEQGHHLTTVVRGFAASMGGVIALAGDTRLIGAESFIHVHEISSGVGGKLSEVKDEVAFMEKMNQKVEDLYVSRTKLKRGEFRKRYVKSELWIDATEAIKWGVSHAVG